MRVLQAQEEERNRIARELHDGTAQSLATLLINLDVLEPHLPADDATLQTGFSRLKQLTNRTLDEVRGLSHALRPAILDDVGLIPAIQACCDEWTETFGVPVRVELEPVPGERLPTEIETALFRIVQEALMNAGKYAAASAVRVALSFSDESVQLVVEDDGAGFDVTRLQGPTRHGGLGLYSMQERAALLGGTLTIDTTPGNGTRITVTGPLA
jgi:signal transduction histidine kinase